MNKKLIISTIIALIIIAVAGGFLLTREQDDAQDNSTTTTANTTTATTNQTDTTTQQSNATATEEMFSVDVWADNWFALYVNGTKVGEDSVPITTERSFNKETFTFTAARPLTIAIEAKDFKETDSGIEYIGQNNQQMGDGGLIAQFKDANGGIVAVTDATWATLVTHKAPLDKSCEKSADPDTECEFLVTATPTNWFSADYDVSGWTNAMVYSESAVSPKDGYNEVSWDSSAQLVWGTDLEQDNTILFRKTVN